MTCKLLLPEPPEDAAAKASEIIRRHCWSQHWAVASEGPGPVWKDRFGRLMAALANQSI